MLNTDDDATMDDVKITMEFFKLKTGFKSKF